MNAKVNLPEEPTYYYTEASLEAWTKGERKEHTIIIVLYINPKEKYIRLKRSEYPMGHFTEYDTFCDMFFEIRVREDYTIKVNGVIEIGVLK